MRCWQATDCLSYFALPDLQSKRVCRILPWLESSGLMFGRAHCAGHNAHAQGNNIINF